MSSTADIWVLVEHKNGYPQQVTFEMLGEAGRIAALLRTSVMAVALGLGLQGLPDSLGPHGAEQVLLAEAACLEPYTTDAHAAVLETLLRARNPKLLLIADSHLGRDLAPRLAARLGTGLVTGCTSVTADPEGNLQAVEPVYRQMQATMRFGPQRPAIATLRPGVVGVERPLAGARPVVESISVDEATCHSRTRVLRVLEADPKTVDLAEADLIVAGGRGVGGAGGWPLVEELAEALGASVGGSRVPADQGCIPYTRVIGQSGKFVAPRLYVAAGISGASQHTSGVRDARCVVAVNRDRGAPILRMADLALVGDLHEVLPLAAEKVREARLSTSRQTERRTATE